MPIKRRLTVIEKQRIVPVLAERLLMTEGVLISYGDKKKDTITLAIFIKNPNIKSKKDKGTRRNHSLWDL